MDEARVIKISASRLKTFESCSWMYFCKYVLKMPDKGNKGANKGSICHVVYECLWKKGRAERKKYIKNLIKRQTIEAIPSIARLVRRQIKQYEFLETADFGHISEMIIKGVSQEGFLPDSKIYEYETEGEFKIDIGNVTIGGFIDGFIKNKKTGEVIIRDYKSSKKRFTPKEINYNVQALTYALATYKLHGVIPSSEFWFVQHGNIGRKNFDEPLVQSVREYSLEELQGFEAYLNGLAPTMRNYNESIGKENFAWDKGYPKDEEGFTKKLLCAPFNQEKHQLKKDGTPMWYCPFKYDSEYYQVLKDGVVIDRAFKKEELENKYNDNKNCSIVKKYYDGCPKFLH